MVGGSRRAEHTPRVVMKRKVGYEENDSEDEEAVPSKRMNEMHIDKSA
jgi:hypothetical protein